MKNRIITLTIFLIVGLLLIFGSSYAIWYLTLEQETTNILTTDCLDIAFEEGDAITLNNAYPMAIEEVREFVKTAKPYKFKIRNMCQSPTNIYINLETLEPNGKRLKDEYINSILYDGKIEIFDIDQDNSYENAECLIDNPEEIPKLDNATNSYNLMGFSLGLREEREFNLLLYMNEMTPTTEDTMNAIFESKIVVTADYVPEYQFISTIKEKVKKIIFQNTMNPFEGENVVFASDKGLGIPNTMNYVVKDDANYILYIQTNGTFKFPENSSYMFSGFRNLVSIEGLEYIDTNEVTTMSSMFYNCNNLTSLDLSSFDTSQVTDMSYMFYNCNNLTSLDLSNFDTSQVTYMNSMFERCNNLTSLDLSNFDTSKVTSMGSMFKECNNLISLDLSNFDTSQVIYMNSMFYNCNNLTTLITIKNQNSKKYLSMFYNAATAEGTQITVNYTSESSDLVDQMIATKSASSNVIKGTLVS